MIITLRETERSLKVFVYKRVFRKKFECYPHGETNHLCRKVSVKKILGFGLTKSFA